MRGAAWLVLCACGRVAFDPYGDALAIDPDARSDGRAADAAPFATVVPVLATANNEEDPTGASTKNEIIYLGPPAELFTITRTDEASPWGNPVAFAHNSPQLDAEPRLSADDLTLYFASDRTGTMGGFDIWRSTRTAIGQPWTTPMAMPGVNTTQQDKWFTPCANGQYIISHGTTQTDGDFYEGVLGGAPPVAIAAVNSTSNEISAYVTPDCLTLYFASNRMGTFDLYVSTRATASAPWGAPVLFELADPAAGDQDPWLSPDGKMFLFASDANGNFDLYIATR